MDIDWNFDEEEFDEIIRLGDIVLSSDKQINFRSGFNIYYVKSKKRIWEKTNENEVQSYIYYVCEPYISTYNNKNFDIMDKYLKKLNDTIFSTESILCGN